MSINDWRRRTDPPERSRTIRLPRDNGWLYVCNRCGRRHSMVDVRDYIDPPRKLHNCTCGGLFVFQSKCSTKKRRKKTKWPV
jgi:hypothetical protein